MARAYTLKRRAENQAATRQKIVEAAVDLHTTVGPASTTVSMIAEKAGVQRHTFYAHFPDERSLFLACSGHAAARDPMPKAEAWGAVADPRERIRVGLRELYDWYGRNAALTGSVLRDAEHHPIVREMVALRRGRVIDVYREVLGAGLGSDAVRLLEVALSFYTWRSLVAEGGLAGEAAADLMARAITCRGLAG
ncbi:MAG TPA: TetR/AcrR family transcriptional regulator [Bauldia sp.]|nr:TetR/AcrR family transcriptional regulator [Bauldia sp.]